MITQILPGVALISLEPLKEEVLQLECTLRDIPGAQAFNVALGDKAATLEIHRSDFSQSSSLRPMAKLHKEAFPESAGERIARMEVRKLDEM
jgi:hypothetical protein